MTEPINATDATFNAEVLESDVPVLVDYWATWCQPCRKMAPVLDELAGELEGKVKIVKVDVDANPNVTLSQGVSSLPTLNVYKNGELVSSMVGAQQKRNLVSELESHM